MNEPVSAPDAPLDVDAFEYPGWMLLDTGCDGEVRVESVPSVADMTVVPPSEERTP
ncbi:hypothetical protein [Deinococcus ruber]|uniref:hypothetical protein n=1 Tax=Deinococcus ruber TaxID=1848197 RepID=UPI00166AD611|nr:hypothetical protein [Deinococcus ruber]